MTAVAIVREETETGNEARYHAVTKNGSAQSFGRTAGEALDALTVQLGGQNDGTLVIVQQMQPDALFTEAQIRRLRELSDRSKIGQLAIDDQAELESLISAELLASAQRSAALADALGR